MPPRASRKPATSARKGAPSARAETPEAVLPDLPYRRALFVLEYLVDLNATQAAIRAGYSEASADVEGARLLGNASVAAAIADAMDARAARTAITADRVLRELAVIGFSDTRHYRLGESGGIEVAADAPPSASRAISSVKHKTRTDADGHTVHEAEYRLWSKTDALKQLGEHLGLYTKRIEANVNVTGTPGRLEESARADMLRRFLAERGN